MGTINRKDFTQRDRESFSAEIVAFIQRNYPTIVVDFSENSLSLEAMAKDMITHAHDTLSMYQDAAFSEAYPDSAAEPQSFHSMAALVGVILGRRTAAVTDLAYTYEKLQVTAPTSLILATGTDISNTSGFTWTVVTALQTVSEGAGTFEAHQGSYVSDIFTPTTDPDQVFILDRSNIAFNVAPVVKVSTVTWTRVDSVARAGVGTFYELRYIGDGQMAVVFGDGANGDIPVGNIEIIYFVTDGDSANTGINSIVGEIHPHVGVKLSYANEVVVDTGVSGNAVRDARKTIQGAAISQDTETSESDYLAIITAQAGVGYASFEFSETLRRNVCYVMSPSYTALTDGALARLAREVGRGKEQMFTDTVFKNISFAQAMIAMTVVFSRTSSNDTEQNKKTVSDAIHGFFYPAVGNEKTNDVGKIIRLSDFYRMVDALVGVDYLNLDVFTRIPELTAINWSDSSNAVILDGWHIRPTSASVKSSGIGQGLQSGLGTISDAAQTKIQRSDSMLSVSSSLRQVGVRASTDDWRSRGNFSAPDELRLKISNASRGYVWPDWLDADGNFEVPLLKNNLSSRYGSKTAHFTVSQFFSGEVFSENSVGYLDVPYEIEGGSCVFLLTAPTATGSTAIRIVCDGSGYGQAELGHGLIKAGSILGYITDQFGNTIGIVDNGGGALFRETDGDKVGYIDYDTGWFIFEWADGFAYCGRKLIISYEYFTLDNRPGETASMFISPLVGDIKVNKREFCALNSLSLELGME